MGWLFRCRGTAAALPEIPKFLMWANRDSPSPSNPLRVDLILQATVVAGNAREFLRQLAIGLRELVNCARPASEWW